MMNSKSKASQDAKLLKDFVEAIERRAKQIVVDGDTEGFSAGYLAGFIEMFDNDWNMTPKMRKAIKARLAILPPKMKKVKNLMTGKTIEIAADTPYCCDPSTETFWSM